MQAVKRSLSRAQRFALVTLAQRERMKLDAFVELLAKAGEPIDVAVMSVELLMLYGLIAPRVVPGQVSGEVTATLRLQTWYAKRLAAQAAGDAKARKAPRHLRVPTLRMPSIAAIAVATTLAAGCAALNHDEPVAAERTPQPAAVRANMYANNMVYRYCAGPECLAPTPKVPAAQAPTRPRTTTVDYPNQPVPPAFGTPAAPAVEPLVQAPPAPASSENSRLVEEVLKLRAALADLEAKFRARNTPETTAPAVTSRQDAARPPAIPLSAAEPVKMQAKIVAITPATPSKVTTPSITDANRTADKRASKPSATDSMALIAPPKAPDVAQPIVKVAAAEPTTLKLDADFTSFKAMVQFDDGEQTLDGLNKQKVIDLAPKARMADTVRVRGYAAVAELDETTRKIAVGRALAVKNVLVEHDVPAAKVKILDPHNRLIDPKHPNAAANRAVAIDVVMPNNTKATQS